MVRRAVFAVAKALFLLELGCARGTAPGDETGGELNVVCQLVLVFVELFDEVESEHVVAAIPQFNLGEVVRVRESKLGRKGRFRIACHCEVLQDLARVLTHEHRRDPDASARAIVAHNDVSNVFFAVIHNHDKRGACPFGVAHLSYEGAVAAV